jgi:hypothetical protein
MPIEGEHLIVEPTHPAAQTLAGMSEPAPRVDAEKFKLRNRWWSNRLHCEIYIWEEDDKITWGLAPGFNHIGYDIRTLGCSFAWGIEQESNAVNLLASLLRHHQMKQYLLTGMFLERSARSGLSYLFRRLKPTIVLDARGDDPAAPTKILCALCLHPIAYYANTWAGAMAPTDDVIAHLMLMRGDEPMLWRRANQHPPTRPEAGL